MILRMGDRKYKNKLKEKSAVDFTSQSKVPRGLTYMDPGEKRFGGKKYLVLVNVRFTSFYPHLWFPFLVMLCYIIVIF